MSEHPIQGLMQTSMENLKEMVDVNTIVGDPVETPSGDVIIPISKVGFGFASGGTEFESESNTQNRVNGSPFGGGAGGGVSITPVAFLVVGKNGVKTIPLEGSNTLYDKIFEYVPQVMRMLSLNIDSIKKSNSSDKSTKEDPFEIQ